MNEFADPASAGRCNLVDLYMRLLGHPDTAVGIPRKFSILGQTDYRNSATLKPANY